MKVDYMFASHTARLAAEIVADGWPHGTFENPDFTLAPDSGFETAVMCAAHATWGGPGWWRKNMSKANRCLQTIRWVAVDEPQKPENENLARNRWASLETNEKVILLLLAAEWLKAIKPSI